METNWSLILNLALLMIVITALIYTLKRKREPILPMQENKPSLGVEEIRDPDDIIAVRKIEIEETSAPVKKPQISAPRSDQKEFAISSEKTLMIFLLAKPNRQLAGYEMLQTILSVGLRFGEGQLFHRHESTNGQGPILCSLAAATPTGVFDLHNMGAFNARGLCLFMRLSDNQALDIERLDSLFETASQLAEGLDTLLLDEKRKPFTPETKMQYRQLIESSANRENT